jgi:translation initiation factor 4G
MGFSSRERDVYLGSYVGLSTMIGQMVGSCVSGVVVDKYNRKYMLIIILVIGALAMGLFGIVRYYPILLVLRVVTGAGQGFVVPLLFSLLGDFYNSEDRPTNSAIVSSCLGGGMMLGQLFAGYSLQFLGWRIPFIVMGVATLCATVFIRQNLAEAVKGSQEDGLVDILSKGISLPRLTISTFFGSMLIPTVAMMLLQTIPNTIPWGILSAHLHDLLATDANLSMQEATSLIAIYGAGAAAGGLFGGYIGSRVYSSSRMLLPMFMGVTMMISALLMQELLSMDLEVPGSTQLACPVLLLSGALAAVNGANIRVIILNLTYPEARGATIAVLNLVNCIGRGIGPMLIEVWMEASNMTRKHSVSFFLNLWLVSGSLLCISSLSIARDEDRMKAGLKKFAQSAIESATNSQKQQHIDL